MSTRTAVRGRDGGGAPPRACGVIGSGDSTAHAAAVASASAARASTPRSTATSVCSRTSTCAGLPIRARAPAVLAPTAQLWTTVAATSTPLYVHTHTVATVERSNVSKTAILGADGRSDRRTDGPGGQLGAVEKRKHTLVGRVAADAQDQVRQGRGADVADARRGGHRRGHDGAAAQ